MNQKKPIIYALISFALFFIASFYITYPLLFHLGDRVTGFGDELLIAWIQNWVIHSLMTKPFGVFDSNLYYPYHNTLAYTETFMVTSILAIPAKFIVGEPIATVNFTLFSSIILFGFSIYLLCFYLTRNFFVSLFSGMLVVFSPAVLDCTTALQFLSIECVPLAILFFLHFMKTRRSRYLGISLLFFVLQMYNSIQPGFMIAFSYAVILLIYSKKYKKKMQQFISIKNSILLAIAFIPVVVIANPYFFVAHQFHYSRDIRDSIHFALQPEDFLYPGSATRLHDILLSTISTNQYSQNGEFHAGYLGVVFTLLVIFVFGYIIRNFRKIDYTLAVFLCIALVGLVLSLGPFLHLGRHTIHKPFPIPLPYALFYYILPGFSGLRDSARWNLFFIIGMAATIALILDRLLQKYSVKTRIIIYVLLLFGVIVEYNFPMKFYPISPFRNSPPVYSWLATTPSYSTTIEMPIYNWNSYPFLSYDQKRVYYSIANFRRTVNGASGFSPPPWQKLVTSLNVNFPSKGSINELNQLGVDYVIVHTNENCSKTAICGHEKNKDGKGIIKLIIQSHSFKLVKQFKNTYIFKLSSS
jgi:hypothetical protein